jgi:hypothetical protein
MAKYCRACTPNCEITFDHTQLTCPNLLKQTWFQEYKNYILIRKKWYNMECREADDGNLFNNQEFQIKKARLRKENEIAYEIWQTKANESIKN